MNVRHMFSKGMDSRSHVRRSRRACNWIYLSEGTYCAQGTVQTVNSQGACILMTQAVTPSPSIPSRASITDATKSTPSFEILPHLQIFLPCKLRHRWTTELIKTDSRLLRLPADSCRLVLLPQCSKNISIGLRAPNFRLSCRHH